MKMKVAANLFRGPEAVGGHLFFDENEMVFTSHALNIQTGETRIAYADIAAVEKRNTLGLVPNGICVRTKDFAAFNFVLWNRKEIIPFIKEKANIE